MAKYWHINRLQSLHHYSYTINSIYCNICFIWCSTHWRRLFINTRVSLQSPVSGELRRCSVYQSNLPSNETAREHLPRYSTGVNVMSTMNYTVRFHISYTDGLCCLTSQHVKYLHLLKLTPLPFWMYNIDFVSIVYDICNEILFFLNCESYFKSIILNNIFSSISFSSS